MDKRTGLVYFNNMTNDNSKKETRSQLFTAGSYLNRFFSEKNISTEIFEKTDGAGNLHIIDTEIVISHISTTAGAERVQVENIIRKIDFANGNLNHFFGYLAQAIADQH